MGRGLMPVQPRRRPDNSRGGGDPPCVTRLGTGFGLKAGKWAAVREGSGKPLP